MSDLTKEECLARASKGPFTASITTDFWFRARRVFGIARQAKVLTITGPSKNAGKISVIAILCGDKAEDAGNAFMIADALNENGGLRRAEETRISTALKELEENPLKPGDSVHFEGRSSLVNEYNGTIRLGSVRIDHLEYLIRAAIHGGATIVRSQE